jgi:DNA-directed RNA polymerase specialized sigma24 family protein
MTTCGGVCKTTSEGPIDPARHTGLVFHVANRLTRVAASKGLDIDDLVSEGRLALTKAAPRYDPSRGAGVAGFLVVAIKSKLFQLLARAKPLSQLPAVGEDGAPFDVAAPVEKDRTAAAELVTRLLRVLHGPDRAVVERLFGLDGEVAIRQHGARHVIGRVVSQRVHQL